MSKRIKNLLIAAATLCIAAAVGLTLAFMFKKAEKTNRFIPAEVSCAVREKMDGNEVNGTDAVGVKNRIYGWRIPAMSRNLFA